MKKMLVLAVLSSSMMFADTPAETAVEAAKTVAATVSADAPKAAGYFSKAWNKIVRPFRAVGGYATSAKDSVVSATGSVAKSVKTNATKAVVFVGDHKKSTAVVAAVAGIAILYNTNEAFRNKVRSLLGLDKTEVQNA